jgi:ABC-type Fe3+/spermidine/putrescine transport system ATPase subunit
MASVRLERLRKSFGPVIAVRDISIEFQDGRMTSVLGPSGCGKTTTLNLIAGFIEPDGGSISFGERLVADPARGIAVPPNRRDLGMVFQSYALWPHLSIGANVAYGLKMRNIPRADREKTARRALQRVRLEGLIDRYPHELSGGQQQRAALARALAYSPQIVLFDEPLSNLDAQLRDEMRLELKDIHRSIGVTAVYVTHDQAEAMGLSDTIVVMGEGEILQVGSPRSLYEEPADVRVARFIGKANIFDAIMVDRQQQLARVKVEGIEKPLGCRVPDGAAANAHGAVSIRPEAVLLKPAGAGNDGMRGRISSTLYLGNMSQYRVALGAGRTLDVQQLAADTLQVGEEVFLEIDPQRCYFIVGGSERPAP